MRLHGYFRSTAAWRVRIALNLKGLRAEAVAHHLRRGEQRAEAYLRLNPQGLVPALELDGVTVLTQSLAIIAWLEETHPEPPLLPRDPLARARVRAFALAIACDIHPVQNLKVLARLRSLGIPEPAVTGWAREVIAEGLGACEALLAGRPRSGAQDGPFCFGAAPTLADICLVPQMSNARRFGVDLTPLPRLRAIEAACQKLPAFAAVVPERPAGCGAGRARGVIARVLRHHPNSLAARFTSLSSLGGRGRRSRRMCRSGLRCVGALALDILSEGVADVMGTFSNGSAELVGAFGNGRAGGVGTFGNGLAGVMGALPDRLPNLTGKLESRVARERRDGGELADRDEDPEHQHAGRWLEGRAYERTAPAHR